MDCHYNVYGCFREPSADIELAKRAVDAGFGGIWIGDHFLPWISSRPYTHHILPWFGALMNEVPDVPVGTSVTCPMLRYRPPLLAQALATLDSMYPGRFHLGLGVGEALNEAHFLDDWPEWGERAAMMIETIDLLEKLWTADEYLEFDGEYFQYEGIRLHTEPKASLPIHWAAWGPTSCTLAGKHADHLITAASPKKIREKIIPPYKDGLSTRGRSLDDVDVTTEVSINIGDPDELVQEIRDRGEYVPHDQIDSTDPREIQREADDRLAAMSDEEIRTKYNITDDPEEVVRLLREYERAGVTRVLVGSKCGDPHETISVMEEHVLPEFD
ncbi:LLM class flavin-dependent oxidoreductase [Natrononativus amylolyticus]|uniref:LLM class flavin-dependent oxidoreductase n=1 Tax=Natrononativus amylolyticus TaxID=2963434 RepID=UPI0020CDF90E|nr:LLM class flavin-dependent oxidoreductase [Natrononativus amylolyticus]